MSEYFLSAFRWSVALAWSVKGAFGVRGEGVCKENDRGRVHKEMLASPVDREHNPKQILVGQFDKATFNDKDERNDVVDHREDSDVESQSCATSARPKAAQPDEVVPYPPQTEWNDDVLNEIARLGEGAGGTVHEVHDKRTGQVLARKTIPTREAPMKQLIRELKLITTISHPNIIGFYGAYMNPSSSEVKVVMEVCDGKSLEAVSQQIKARGARVGEKVAGRIAEGVLQGLAYLYSRKVIHRDIKPANILLSRDGIVKLCDFGVSGELVESVASTFTGTSLYMAPERVSGRDYSIRSDVWSAGLSLLELVQNRFPLPTNLPPIDFMVHITQSEPPQLEDEDGVHWSDAMKDFIKETLRVDPVLRPSPRDLLAHEWIVKTMMQEVNMARWTREVWGWPKTAKTTTSHESALPEPAQSVQGALQ